MNITEKYIRKLNKHDFAILKNIVAKESFMRKNITINPSLDARLFKILKRSDINIQDLKNLTVKEFMEYRGVGIGVILRAKYLLNKCGLSFKNE